MNDETLERSYFDVVAAGRRLRVQRIGRASAAPTLVFLHEGLGSIAQWKGFPSRLARALDLPAIVYERWGFGASEPLALPRPRDYLHREAAHVFVEAVSLAGIREAVQLWRTTDLPRRLARYHGDQAETVFRGWSETWLSPEFHDWDITDRLPRIVCPLLAIQGADDHYGTPRQVETIVTASAGPAEALMVPDCGHTPHHEAEDRVLAAMTAFISRYKDRPVKDSE